MIRKILRTSPCGRVPIHPCTGIFPNGERCKESDPVVLQFHHALGKKVADVSVLMGRGSSLEKLIAEIATAV